MCAFTSADNTSVILIKYNFEWYFFFFLLVIAHFCVGIFFITSEHFHRNCGLYYNVLDRAWAGDIAELCDTETSTDESADSAVSNNHSETLLS